MNNQLKKYFIPDDDAFYQNSQGIIKFRGIKGWYGDTVRLDKAINQAKLEPIPLSEVFSHVNNFLELLRHDNKTTSKNVQCDVITLDNTLHLVLDNGIIAKSLSWSLPNYNNKLGTYDKWDDKYNKIQTMFSLSRPSNILWIKFTKQGYVGVVAKSFDINFKTDNSSGILINKVNQELNEDFVFIFPLTDEILGDKSTGEVELAVGQYLIEMNVPIIDFYSHNN